MKVVRLLIFCALLFLPDLLGQSPAWLSSYAQSPNISDDIIQVDNSPGSKIIEVTAIDYLFDVNPSTIYVSKDRTDVRRTALVPTIKTKDGGCYYAFSGWRVVFTGLSLIVMLILIIILLKLIVEREKINLLRAAIGFCCVSLTIILAIAFVKAGTWTQHLAVIYFDNASNSKYEVAVNGERFKIDEMSHVCKQISWGSLSGTVEEVVEIRIFSTAPNAEEMERSRVRLEVDSSSYYSPSKRYVYNIGRANSYTVRTQGYR